MPTRKYDSNIINMICQKSENSRAILKRFKQKKIEFDEAAMSLWKIETQLLRIRMELNELCQGFGHSFSLFYIS